MVALRGAINYDHETEMMRTTDVSESWQVRMDVLKNFTGRMYERYQRYVFLGKCQISKLIQILFDF